jgi:zona occludens toxin (predicted ATPase)
MIDLLKKGRKVYTNMDGLNDEGCRMAIYLVSGIEREKLDSQLVYMTREQTLTFWTFVDIGSVIIVDEVHKLWSSRTYASESNKAFAEWCSTHRHHGHDVILITQALDKLDGHVRSLIEWTHRCRKVNFIGKMVKRSYLEYVYSEDDERNCLSRKRKTYNPVIFRCYQSYVAKDIKEKGIGKATNILRHPIFYFIPVIMGIFVYLLLKTPAIHGDMFGTKAHAAAFEKGRQKVASSAAPVSLNASPNGFYKGGKWVSLPAKITDKGFVPVGSEKEHGAAPEGAGVPPSGAYRPPATVDKKGSVWTFTDSTGRVVGTVVFSDGVSAAAPPASRADAGAREPGGGAE